MTTVAKCRNLAVLFVLPAVALVGCSSNDPAPTPTSASPTATPTSADVAFRPVVSSKPATSTDCTDVVASPAVDSTIICTTDKTTAYTLGPAFTNGTQVASAELLLSEPAPVTTQDLASNSPSALPPVLSNIALSLNPDGTAALTTATTALATATPPANAFVTTLQNKIVGTSDVIAPVTDGKFVVSVVNSDTANILVGLFPKPSPTPTATVTTSPTTKPTPVPTPTKTTAKPIPVPTPTKNTSITAYKLSSGGTVKINGFPSQTYVVSSGVMTVDSSKGSGTGPLAGLITLEVKSKDVNTPTVWMLTLVTDGKGNVKSGNLTQTGSMYVLSSPGRINFLTVAGSTTLVTDKPIAAMRQTETPTTIDINVSGTNI